MRFKRSYTLTATREGDTVTIADPIRIQFDAVKSVIGFGPNKLTAKIFGLSERSRHIFVKSPEEQVVINVTLSVGYAGTNRQVFQGDVLRGSVQLTDNSFLTSIESYDGGTDFFNSYTAKTITGKSEAIDAVIADMPNTVRGTITELEQLSRPKVLIGNSYELLYDMVGKRDSMFIDDGAVNMLKENEVLDGLIPLVSARTGLIDAPERDLSRLTFRSTINPYVQIGKRVQLESIVSPQYNGEYKVITIVYTGDLEGNDWSQQVIALFGLENKVI